MTTLKLKTIVASFFLVPFLIMAQQAPTINFATKHRLENKVTFSGSSAKSFSIEISSSTHDSKRTDVGIEIDAYSYERFYKFLNAVADKYENWTQVAKENNISSYYKKLDFTEVAGGYYWVGDDWHIDDEVQYQAYFNVTKSGGVIQYEMTIISFGDKLYDPDENFFSRCDDVYLTFSNPKELRKVIDFINIETNEEIKNYLNRPKKDDLFK